MEIKYKDIIKKLLKNERIQRRVNKYELTEQQMLEALPIMIDMDEDKEDGIKDYLTSFYVSKSGHVMRSHELSEHGKENEYKNNIITSKIQYFDFTTKENFDKTAERRQLVTALAEYKEKAPSKGIYIYGSTGVGKTFIAKRFALLLARAGKKIGFINVPDLSISIKSSFGDGFSAKEDYLNKLKDVEILFLDDLGGETITQWFRDEFLYPVIAHRTENGLTTIITSNYNFDELIKVESKTSRAQYNEPEKARRLVNKLKALVKPIKLDGINRNY